MSFFDECYQTKLNKDHMPYAWHTFWKSQIEELASVPFDLQIKKKTSLKNITQNHGTVLYNSSGGYRIHARYIAPISRKKVPLIVIFPDYLEIPTIYKSFFNKGFAQFVVQLRGHEVPLQNVDAQGNLTPKESYGYFAENLEDKEEYYMKKLYLDAYRTIEIISQITKFDQKRIAIWGKGIGAAMTLFAAKFTKKSKCQIIQYPSFCYLPLLSKCKSAYAKEINSKINQIRKMRNNIFSKTLNYFDASFFAEDIGISSAVFADIKNKGTLPQAVFSIFHELKGEKEMHLIAENNLDEETEQEKQSLKAVIDFLAHRL